MSRVTVKQKNIWLVYGEDPVLVQEKKNELLRRYFKGGGPDPVVFSGGGSFEALQAGLDGQSLFSSETAVVIENPFFLRKALKKEDEKPYALFLESLQAAGSDTFVVMTMDGKPDRRIKAVKMLLSAVSSIECSLLKASDGVELMERRLYDRGISMDAGARSYLEAVLAAWTEISQPFLETECDKIALMCREGGTVTKALLQDALPDYMDQGIFRFSDQLLDRDAMAVRDSFARVFTDPQTVLKNTGFLAAQFRKIKILKELERSGASPSEKMERLGMRSAWQLRNLETAAKKVTETEAEDFLLGLFRSQYEARLGGGQRIEDLLLRFCLEGKEGRKQSGRQERS